MLARASIIARRWNTGLDMGEREGESGEMQGGDTRANVIGSERLISPPRMISISPRITIDFIHLVRMPILTPPSHNSVVRVGSMFVL